VDGRYNGTAIEEPSEEGEILLTEFPYPFVLKVSNDGTRILTLSWEGMLPSGQVTKVPPGSDVVIVHDKAKPAGTLKWKGKTFGVWEAHFFFP
jgi:hypothetical protein